MNRMDSSSHGLIVNVHLIGSQPHKSRLFTHFGQPYPLFCASQFVSKLSQLYLKLGFVGGGSAGEYLEDKLETVNGLYARGFS